MTYWLLTTEYPPFYGGGISTYCYFTVQMLAEKGHVVTVFVNDNTVQDFAIVEDGIVRVVRFSPSRMNAAAHLGHVTNISYEFAHIVKHFIEKEGAPDIIEAQEYLGIAYFLLQYKYLLYHWCKTIPVVITMHSPSFLYLEFNHAPIYKYPNYWIGEMERFCMQAANLVITPSNLLLSEVKKRFNLNNANIVTIANPYKSEITQIQETAGLDKPGQIVFYGKLSAQKGTFKLLSYFKTLWQQGFNQPLYLIGGQDIVYHPEGKMMGDLVKQKYKSYITSGLLKLEDKLTPGEIKNRLAGAELVIVPSTIDNLPYVVFEIMALGKIVLVSKQGGHAEVVKNGENGFIFDHDRPETFYEQLHKVLFLKNEERYAIAINAQKTIVEIYNFETIYAQKINALLQCIAVAHQLPVRFPFIRQNSAAKGKSETDSVKNLLSIVIPYYNMGRYLDATIASLQRIHYSHKEIIIVNDGSTDETSLRVLQRYRKEPGIIVLEIANSGLATARNVGAGAARGEYLAFLDADDLVNETYYQQAIHVFQQYDNVHFAGSWTQYFEGSQKKWPAFIPEPPLILCHNTINSSALVYRREAFLTGGKNDPNMTFQGLEDYESVIALLNAGYGGIVFPEVFFHYRVRADSMIRQISKTKKLFLYRYISNKHKQFYATFATEIFSLLNANGPGIYLDNPTRDYHLMEKLPLLGKLSSTVIQIIKKNRFAKTAAYKVYRLLNK